jgi:hypothetical protein
MYVRPNLHTALRYLRRADIARDCWIDALCINQNDWDERSREVKRMAKIYALADRVVVWLGSSEPDGSSQRALGLLEILGQHIEVTRSSNVFRSPTSALTPGTNSAYPYDFEAIRTAMGVNPYSLLPFQESDYLAIHHLLARPWWDRLWVWQEIQLASYKTILLCGPHSASWPLVRRSLMLLHWRTRYDLHPQLPASLLRRCFGIAKVQPGATLPDLIYWTREAQYSVDHDRVFAILGLVPPDVASHIKADYTVPIYQLLQNVCLAILKSNASLIFMYYCDIGYGQDMSVKPSWVPNWLHAPRLEALPSGYAAGANQAELTSFQDGDTLSVHCIFSGLVRCVAQPAPVKGELGVVLQEWENTARKSDNDNAGMSWKEKLVEILLCGYTMERWPGKIAGSLEQGLAAYDRKDSSSFVHDAVRGRTFFTFENGGFGLGPSMAREGTC